ncbi:cyclin-T2-like isoform X1 [Argiope bruennichi]|uniref:cyclin-T2-like isoform X1 n=1 Tax=Argiope bruennichi TaxID=94029 RepID=UPI0024959E0F|nr:cyclin-T2-like isoform X1 [Argiope bruennichi]
MMNHESRWYFSTEEMSHSPNMKLLQHPIKELLFRQSAATFIQHIGQKLNLSQLCICTATVYIHRFYMFFSLEDVDTNKLSMVSLFLAGKTQNEFRKLEHIIKVAHAHMNPLFPVIDVQSEDYLLLKDELIFLETILLQVLGFEVEIELPHPYIVKICQLIKGSKELAIRSYILATASIMASTLCLQYNPKIVACVCINLGARWSRVEIDSGSEKHPWFYYVDSTLNAEFLNELTDELGKTILKNLISMNSPVLTLTEMPSIPEEVIVPGVSNVKEIVVKIPRDFVIVK